MSIQTESTIAILGGAGRAGQPLVQQALAAGYSVRVLLRHPETFDLTHERLVIVQGDARRADCIRELVRGCDALLSTLGHPKGEATPIMAAVTEQIVAILPALGIRRYVVVSSLFVTGREQPDEPTRRAAEYMERHFPLMMADRRREFRILAESGLDWTYVRIPFLVQHPATGVVDVNVNHLPGQQITALDLAYFLIELLGSQRYVRQALFVANPPA